MAEDTAVDCTPLSLRGVGVACCGDGPEVGATFGAALYDADERSAVPIGALAASLGCGNPQAVAELRAGETVLDLGSGGGIDVLLSARRVVPTGSAYGVDTSDEMLALSRSNAAKSDATNVEFLAGTLEQVPLPDSAVDVVISHCIINLAADKRLVFAEMLRVLVPGGRLSVSDVVTEDPSSAGERDERGGKCGCIAGALSIAEYQGALAAAGFVDVEIAFTHDVAPNMHGAIIRARRPRTVLRRE